MLGVKHHNHRKTFKILNFIYFCLTCQKTIMTLYIYIYKKKKLENPGNIVLSNQKKKI
jgi:hypothetical protein